MSCIATRCNLTYVFNQKLTSVTNLVDLITQDYEGEHCQEIMHDIAKKYSGQYKSIGAMFWLLLVLSDLRRLFAVTRQN